MCAYTLTVFTSVFQLLPTAPYHILDLGGGTTAAGMFLGLLTFASALSAPFTGALVDRVGQRRILISVSAILTLFPLGYAVIHDYRVLLAVVVVHGVFWSALLSASGAYITSTVPASRRAEGIGYWGLMSAIAVGIAPALGFFVYKHGWVTLCAEMFALNLTMAFIASCLPDDPPSRSALRRASPTHESPLDVTRGDLTHPKNVVDWRVLRLAVTMGLVAFGYGGLTTFSALFVDALHVSPRSLFLTTMAGTLVVVRLGVGRRLDGFGHRRALLPCLITPAAGIAMMAIAHGRVGVAASAVVFGAGFGLMYPAFTAYVFTHVDARRRGAAYGAMLAAFDTGIGTGSTVIGWLIGRYGFRPAFGVAAGLAALALPYFLVAEKRLGFRHSRMAPRPH